MIDNYQQWIQYNSQMINLKFVDCAASELMPASSSACQTALTAAWCRSFDSDELFDFDSQIWSSY